MLFDSGVRCLEFGDLVLEVLERTLDIGSSVRQASSTASETWSASLSGWPSFTDSEENRKTRSSADTFCFLADIVWSIERVCDEDVDLHPD